MFTNGFKLDGIDEILSDINYLGEESKDENAAGEDQEHKYPKKSGKKSKDYDDDGEVEDETDEYAGVKDRAIKKAIKKEEVELDEAEVMKFQQEKDAIERRKKMKGYEPPTKGPHAEKKAPTRLRSGSLPEDYVNFESVLDELTDEDLLFLSDELIEEVVEEFFYETLEEGFEVEELETLLIEQVESELNYLAEASVTTGHDTESQPEESRPSKLARIKSAVQKVASGAKKVAKKVAGAAGEVAGSAVAGYKKASAAAQDAPGGSSKDDSSSDTPNTGSRTPRSSSSSGTNRPGILGRVGAALKSGLKKAIHGAGKVAGKVVKTAKAGYDEGRGKSAPASTSSAKPVAKTATAKKKSSGNLDNLLNNIRNEENVMEDQGPCWKGYQMIGTKDKGGKKVPNCVPKEEYTDLERDMLEEGYTFDQVLEVIAAYEDGYQVIFEEDGVVIDDTQEVISEEFLSDVETVADWLHTEGIIENEDEFFELMEDLSEEEIEELYSAVMEATAMAKRGHDETAIRNKIAKATGGGKSADRATALADKSTYGNTQKKTAREKLARTQRGDFRKTNSSNPGLHGLQHKSNDPAVKAKQAARGAQRGSAALTPNEKKNLNMGYEMLGNSLEEGGLEVRTYSWRQVLESQEARNNPEKYEAGENKKTAPVRGERTPMPPRGNKKREDFEKWYAANVR